MASPLRSMLGQIAGHATIAAIGATQMFLQAWLSGRLERKLVKEGFEKLQDPIRWNINAAMFLESIKAAMWVRSKEHPEEVSRPLYAHVTVVVDEDYDYMGAFVGVKVKLLTVQIMDQPLAKPIEKREPDFGTKHNYITFSVPIER